MPLAVQAGRDTQAECLFNWAEGNYPSLFAPSGTPTVFLPDNTSRHYSATNTKLRVSTGNNHVYYRGGDGVEQDVGALADWLPKAGCPLPPSLPECLFDWAERDYIPPCFLRQVPGRPCGAFTLTDITPPPAPI